MFNWSGRGPSFKERHEAALKRLSDMEGELQLLRRRIFNRETAARQALDMTTALAKRVRPLERVANAARQHVDCSEGFFFEPKIGTDVHDGTVWPNETHDALAEALEALDKLDNPRASWVLSNGVSVEE